MIPSRFYLPSELEHHSRLCRVTNGSADPVSFTHNSIAWKDRSLHAVAPPTRVEGSLIKQFQGFVAVWGTHGVRKTARMRAETRRSKYRSSGYRQRCIREMHASRTSLVDLLACSQSVCVEGFGDFREAFLLLPRGFSTSSFQD